MIVVLMGVTGSGKTTIGTQLAGRMGLPFAEGDDYHSAHNKAKMKAGHPLDDEDRAPWLKALNSVLRTWQSSVKGGVLACSALKEKYRETLKDGMPEGSVHFVLLDATKEMLEDRVAHRQHEFMNPALLASQMKTLEAPKDALVVTNDRAPEDVVDEIYKHLSVDK